MISLDPRATGQGARKAMQWAWMNNPWTLIALAGLQIGVQGGAGGEECGAVHMADGIKIGEVSDRSALVWRRRAR